MLSEFAALFWGGWIEIIAVVFGIAGVALTVRQNIWCWPVGIVSVALYTWIFFDVRLYSDMLLSASYVVFQIYGWWVWSRREEGAATVLEVTRVPPTHWFIALCAVGVGVAALGTFMAGTDADLPYVDALTTVVALAAQYFMAKKQLENWAIWIAVDLLAAGVYAYKGLYLTSGLYGLYAIMAVVGLVTWTKSYRTSLTAA